MKKNIILPFVVALVAIFGSCTKTDDSGLSTSERIYEYQVAVEKTLSEAPNGWAMEYFADVEYGGAMLFMKFDNGQVTMSSLRGGVDYTESSLYSYAYDNGVTLNFDTYNSIIHHYASPDSGVGSTGVGMNGDFEFRVESYSDEQIVLKGKKHSNIIVMTPLSADESWESIIGDYRDYVYEVSEKLAALKFKLGETVNHSISYATVTDYPSSFSLCSVRESETGDDFILKDEYIITAPFIYTLDKKLRFYDTLEIGGAKIQEMEWIEQDGCFYSEAVDATIYSEDLKDITVSFSPYFVEPVSATIKASYSKDYYATMISQEEYNSYSSEVQLMKSICSNVSSYEVGSGDYYVTNRGLTPDAAYKLIAFSVEINDLGSIQPTSNLESYDFQTEPVDLTPNAEYDRWIGTWRLTSTTSLYAGVPISLDVVIAKHYNAITYEVYGWDVSSIRWENPIIAQFDDTDNSMIFHNNTPVDAKGNSALDGYTVSSLASCKIPGLSDSTYVGGDYPAIYGTIEDDIDGNVSAVMECYEGVLGSDYSFTVNNIVLLSQKDGYLYTFAYDSSLNLDSDEVLIGPFTLEKVSDGTSDYTSVISVAAPSDSIEGRVNAWCAPLLR